MTIALKIGDEDSQVKGFIYLDAVTTYTRTMGGKVTSHPVDSGVNISDHYIGSNRKFQLEGVITGADLTGISALVKLGNEKPMNAREQPQAAEISGTEDTLKYLPAGVGQFFQNRNPRVSGQQGDSVSLPEVEEILSNLLTGVFYNEADKRWRNKMVTTTLYEMNGVNFTNARTDLVITDVTIREDADTGTALFISMSLEKVRFVSIGQTAMAKNANSTTKKKAAAEEPKGKQEPETGKADTETKSTTPSAPALNFGGAKDALNVKREQLNALKDKAPSGVPGL